MVKQWQLPTEAVDYDDDRYSPAGRRDLQKVLGPAYIRTREISTLDDNAIDIVDSDPILFDLDTWIISLFVKVTANNALINAGGVASDWIALNAGESISFGALGNYCGGLNIKNAAAGTNITFNVIAEYISDTIWGAGSP